jgi:hypothetical protein
VEVLADLDLELAAVERDRDGRVAAAQDVGDGRAARAGAARRGLPHPALEDPRTDGGVVECREPGDVGAVGELRVALDRRADGGEVEGLEGGRVGDVDRGLRVADHEVLEVEAVSLAGVRERRAPHVDAAGRVGEDRGADLAGRGLDRELARVGPAGATQVEDRLARAVAAQLGLGAVGVEDPQARHEARLVGRRQDEDAVGADAGVAVAQRTHQLAVRLLLISELRRLHDHVVVGQRLPLLEAHGGAQPSAGSPSMLAPLCSAT